jgi:hypothetical protein
VEVICDEFSETGVRFLEYLGLLPSHRNYEDCLTVEDDSLLGYGAM